MTRPWLKHYPAGVEPEIPPPAHRSLPEMLRWAMRKYAGQIAFTQCMPNGMNASLTFADVDRHSDAFAAYLREVAGMKQGDRVAVQMPNCLAYPVVAMGILKAGCVLVNTNPLYTAPEMSHQFADAGARAIVIIDLFADRLTPVMPKTKLEKVITVRITEFFGVVPATIVRIVQKYVHKTIPTIEVEHTPFKQALAEGKAKLGGTPQLDRYLAGIGPESLAALQYTGGTTGVAKGAMLSHGNLLSNTSQMITMAGPNIKERDECVLTALPLYHIFAFTVNLLAFFQRGGRNILIPTPRPPKNLKPAFEKFPVTWFTGVNTLFNALTNEEWFTSAPPKSLRVSAAGGMALHPAVAQRWRKITGTAIVEGYGLTESSPVLTFNPIGVPNRDGSIGIPVPSTDIRCVDESGQPVPDGQPGELIAKGPQIMLGYWQKPEETGRTLRSGWLYTGDVARIDEDGYFWIVDRKKDMILVSGFNVYPNEVEEVLAKHPKVKEVGVIGVPDDKMGEAVKAFVVKKEAVTEAELITFCRESLAGYKVPRSVEFREELPKSPIGKIIRKDLRVPVAK